MNKSQKKRPATPKRHRTAHRRKTEERALVKKEPPTVAEAIEHVLIKGDLAPLKAEERLEYYRAVCKSLGLNPLTRPFDYIYFKEKRDENDEGDQSETGGKLVLYANRNCTDQLRQIHKVAIVPRSTTRAVTDDYATTEVFVVNKSGRTDSGLGMVYLKRSYYDKEARKRAWYRLSGQKLADAVMKSETKAKRRATLSICGLSVLDNVELESVEIIGGVTKDGRLWEYPQLPNSTGSSVSDSGHPAGSPKDKMARETGKRVAADEERISTMTNVEEIIKELGCSREHAEKVAERNSERAAKNSPRQAPASDAVSTGATETKTSAAASQSNERKEKESLLDRPSTAGETSRVNAPPNDPMKWKENQEREADCDAQYVGVVKLDLSDPDDPIVWGEIANLTPDLEKVTHSKFVDGWWHLLKMDVPAVRDVCAARKYKLIEERVPTRGKKSASGKEEPRAASGGDGKNTHKTTRTTSSDAGPVEMRGILKRSDMSTSGKPRCVVVFRPDGTKTDYTMSTFDQKFWDHLRDQRAQGKPATLRVQVVKKDDKTYHNIVGLVEVGGKQFDEDGNLVIQKNREAGGRTLFGG